MGGAHQPFRQRGVGKGPWCKRCLKQRPSMPQTATFLPRYSLSENGRVRVFAGHVALRDFVLRCIAKSEKDNRIRDLSRFLLESQGSLHHCLQGTFAIVIKNVCRYQYRRCLECMLIDKRGNADVKCA